MQVMTKEVLGRLEMVVSLSVVMLISNEYCDKLLLVQDAETGMWSPPAGGLEWLESGRMESFTEGLLREVGEEVGGEVERPRLEAVLNLAGERKNRIGVVYSGSLKEGDYRPEDSKEIVKVKFFTSAELVQLLKVDDLRKPEFNRGLVIWWLRNERRCMWDPYRGAEPLDKDTVLDERYLERWLERSIEELDSTD